MDIEKKKAELFAILAELDAEIQTMSDRVTKGVCKYEERGNSDAQKGKRQTGAK
mgnify:CR=1 FL=1